MTNDTIILNLKKVHNESAKKQLYLHLKSLCQLLCDSEDMIEVTFGSDKVKKKAQEIQRLKEKA